MSDFNSYTERWEMLRKRLLKQTKVQLADRLAETLIGLEMCHEDFAELNIAAIYGGEAMDAKKRGGREKLDFIERHALGGWSNSVGLLEEGWWTTGHHLV